MTKILLEIGCEAGSEYCGCCAYCEAGYETGEWVYWCNLFDEDELEPHGEKDLLRIPKCVHAEKSALEAEKAVAKLREIRNFFKYIMMYGEHVLISTVVDNFFPDLMKDGEKDEG